VLVFNILHAEFLAPGIKRFVIEAPRIARKQRPGQFVIVRIHEEGERIPLTIENSDPQKGTINIVVQSLGKTTNLLNSLGAGDHIMDVVGPLGKPSEIEKFGTVVVMGGGVGTAMAYPTAAALKQAGNKVISIVGARNKELVILEREMREVSDVLMITTDDGSYADKGFVTDKLRQLIQNGVPINLVLAIGPIPMMRAVADMTRSEHIRTLVSLNPIMIDGTGMCGGCRVLARVRASSPVWMDPSSMRTRWTSPCWCSAMGRTGVKSNNPWPNSACTGVADREHGRSKPGICAAKESPNDPFPPSHH
jgi:ferredoxin/flavodoxin---NADP+ reductase